MTAEREVWAYVAHKDGMFVGVIAGSMVEGQPPDAAWKKQLAAFCGDFLVDGFEIAKVYDRAQYEALTKAMGVWKREERCPDTVDMFAGKGD